MKQMENGTMITTNQGIMSFLQQQKEKSTKEKSTKAKSDDSWLKSFCNKLGKPGGWVLFYDHSTGKFYSCFLGRNHEQN